MITIEGIKKKILKSIGILKSTKEKKKEKKKKAKWREKALYYRKMLANALRRNTCGIK